MKRYRYKKAYRYKRKKSLFKKRHFWLALLLLLVAAALLYFLFFSPFFQIKEVNLSGEEKLSRQEILSVVQEKLDKKILFIPTRSIWALDTGEIRRELLQKYPQLAGVNFDRDLPTSLKVRVREKEERAVWCSASSADKQSKCFLMDSQGIIFEELAGDSPLMKIRISGAPQTAQLGQSIIEQGMLSAILSIQDKLREETELEMEGVLVVSEERLNFKTREGWQIYFNLADDIDWQIQKLDLVLEKEISPQERESLEYIDLRFSRVYYK